VESPSWQKVLRETEGVHVGLSYMSLRARLPKTKPYLLAERFEPQFEILVDSGGFNADKREGFDHQDHALKYADWVGENIDRISLVTEYDVVSLGLDWVQYWRDRFWKTIPVEKFIPVWHEEYGAIELDRLCNTYPRVGVVKPAGNIDGRLRNLVGITGVKLHGVGITGPDTLAVVPFTTVSSTSWISPSKNGEAHIWASNKLNWYPKSSAGAQKALHRSDIEAAGFDADLVEVGQNEALNHYSAWVWRQYEKQLQERAEMRSGTVVDPDHRAPENFSNGLPVVHRAPRGASNLPAAVPRERIMLPGLNMKGVETANVQGDGTKTVYLPTMSESILRVCSNCSLSLVCPKFEAGSDCAFKIPVSMRTIEELRAWASMLIETQMQRVMMLRLAEEMSGGAPDAALSAEIDRMSKLQLQYKELFEDGFTLSLQVKGRGASGVGIMSRMFGGETGEINQAANGAIPAAGIDKAVASIIGVEVNDE
jgi:hypothetical protein